MQKVIIRDKKSIDADSLAKEAMEIIQIDEQKFHCIIDGKGYRATIININNEANTVEILINNEPFTFKIEGQLEETIKSLNLQAKEKKANANLISTMPGLVLEILVEPGQTVSVGDSLMVLEAMKMENVLKAAADGTITTIKCEVGKPVEKGQTLIEIQ